MRHPLLLLLITLLLVPAGLRAGPLEQEQIKGAVRTWARHVTAGARPAAVIEKMEAYRRDGEILAYIAHLAGGGFCLCGADDLVLPVYFYSPSGEYREEDPGLAFILEEIAERTVGLREASAEGSLEMSVYAGRLFDRSRLWQDLSAGRVPVAPDQAAAEPTMMELNLTSTWNQNSPYNDACPELTPNVDEHTLTGCAATATSQILYYWNWPWSGVGTKVVDYDWRYRTSWDEEALAADPGIPAGWAGGGRLEWTANSGGRLRMNGYWDASLLGAAMAMSSDSAYQTALDALWNRLTPVTTFCGANFGAASYNWNLMQDVHTDPVDPGDAQVAALCYDVAVAIESVFGVVGTGTPLWRVDGPLRDHFRYDPDVVYTNPHDLDMITEEIQWLRPFPLTGSSATSIHAWVIYGYNKGTDPDRQFKMNMGWGGSQDGWYTLDSVPLGLNLHHNHLTHIAPINVVKFVGNTTVGDGSPADPYQTIQDAVVLAPEGSTLILKAGSDNTFLGSILQIDRALTLKGKDATIRGQ